MSWRDNLVQAKFRGVFFYVQSHSYEIGRRNIGHQYPFKDEPYTEDLGLDADAFTIQGYVIANASNNQDYFAARNALINALKKEGPGKLVHPYLGEKNVITFGKTRVSENIAEGGIARFSMSFMLAGKNKYPGEEVDPIGAVDEKVEELIAIVMDKFYTQYTLENQPYFCLMGMYDDFSSYVTMSKQYINRIRNSGSGAIDNIKSTFDDARSSFLEIIRYPCQVTNQVVDCVDSILNAANIITTGYAGKIFGECSERIVTERFSNIGEKINSSMSMSMSYGLRSIAGTSAATGFGAPTSTSTSLGGSLVEIDVTTNSRARQAANRLAFVNMVRAINIVGAARVAIRGDYESFGQSRYEQESLVDCIDYLLLKLGDESASDPYSDYGIYVDNGDLYGQLEDLRGVFISSMKQSALNLAKEIIFEAPPDGMTSLQIAYNQYNDIDREDEIFLRNQPTITHPGFLNGNIDILSE